MRVRRTRSRLMLLLMVPVLFQPAVHQSDVGFLYLAFDELAGQPPVRFVILGDHDEARWCLYPADARFRDAVRRRPKTAAEVVQQRVHQGSAIAFVFGRARLRHAPSYRPAC